MTRDRIAKRLDKAAATGRLVRVVRKKNWDHLDGSIVRVGKKWLLMAVHHQAGFDGHALVRRSDVRRVWPYPYAGFVQRLSQRRGIGPFRGSTAST